MRRLWALSLALALLAGCAARPAEDGRTHILCTTYPVYLFTTAVTQGVEDVKVELLVNQQTSCLHNYTLTVRDMQAIDRADIIVINGAGLEDFLADALDQKDVPVIDCSENIDLLPALDHHHHDGEDETEHEVDPHYWMDHGNAIQMVETVGLELSQRLGNDIYWENATAAADTLAYAGRVWQESWIDFAQSTHSKLISFHDGFQYFADAYGLLLLKSIEEEEGAEASAKELMEVIELVEEYHIPAIFVEKNGSRRSADVIARETGCKVYELDMVMSGEGQGIQPYIKTMEQNLDTVLEALS